MSVTIYDISRALNVSVMTVSRVLNQRNADAVAPATRERVEKAAREMGYRPNRNARALVTGRTNTIALWIGHLRSTVNNQIVEACRKAVQANGMELSVVEMDWHFPTPNTQPRIHAGVDGIIAVDPPESQKLDELLGPGAWQTIPRVNIGSSDSVKWSGDYVHVNMAEGVTQALEQLIRLGGQRIAYCVPSVLAQPGGGHYNTYVNTIRAAGLNTELILNEEWDIASVRNNVREYVKTYGHPDGIFCHHDEMAIATFRALRDLKLRIPEDVALIGCEGNEVLEYFDPPISTVNMPTPEICQKGWELLQERMNNAEVSAQQVTLPFDFQVRESATRHLSTSHAGMNGRS